LGDSPGRYRRAIAPVGRGLCPLLAEAFSGFFEPRKSFREKRKRGLEGVEPLRGKP